MSLTDRFIDLFNEYIDGNPERGSEIAQLVFSAPSTAESDGLLALIYHDGIGVGHDIEKSFEYAERAAFDGGDALGYYMLGYMCDNAETPDQAEGGPRQKYDHYDAERFYEICAESNSPWAEDAHLWLGNYFMNMARGGDPDEAVEHYEAIGEENRKAAGALCDYYMGLFDAYPEGECPVDIKAKVGYWTRHAVRLNPHDYSFKMGRVYAEGIGCNDNFRLARKYFEDAYDFGFVEGAEAIIALYNDKLDNPNLSDWERSHCEKEIISWEKLANSLRSRKN